MDKNIKMISAKLALPYIKDNMIVGLGGGTTMGYVVNFLEKKLSFVTPIVLECIPSSRRYVEVEDIPLLKIRGLKIFAVLWKPLCLRTRLQRYLSLKTRATR